MIKILDYIISKLEWKLSKKEDCTYYNQTSNKKLKLYRKLLNDIDEYRGRTEEIMILRHFRYSTFVIDGVEECNYEKM